MKSPFALIADIINKRPALVAGIVFMLLIVAVLGAGQVYMKTGSDTYMDKTKPAGVMLDHYTEVFSSDSLIAIIESDEPTNPDVLAYMERLETELRDEKYVASVSGVTDYLTIANGGTLPDSSGEINAALKAIPEEYRSKLVPSNLMSLITITLDPGLSEDKVKEVIDPINRAISVSEIPPGVKVTVSGSPAFSKEMGQQMGQEMGTLIGLAMLLMVIAMALLFGHVRYRFLPVAIVGCGIILTFGFMGITGIPISMVVIAAFPVMIGIGIDYAIQFQTRFDEEVRKSSINEAVKTTVTKSGPAILFAMIATSLGFLALVLSPFPMVVDFGVICIVGVAYCYLAALIIVPTFAKLIKYKPKEVKTENKSVSLVDRYDKLLGKVAGGVATYAVVVILILGIVAGIGYQLDGMVPINTDEDSFVPQTMAAKINLDKVQRTIGSTNSIPVNIRTDGLTEPTTMQWILDYSSYESEKHYEITEIASIASIIADNNGGKIPETEEEIVALINSLPENTKKLYINGNLEAVIRISTIEMTIPHSLELIKEMREDLDWYSPPPGMSAEFTGQGTMFADMIDDIKETKDPMTWLGFGMIACFLVLLYRRLSAIAPVIPIIMIVGWNGVIMYTLGLDYTLLTATLGAMTIGVASEYTILIMERYDEERERGLDMHSAIQTAIQKIGTAVTISGMTTVFGFSALTLAAFPIMSNFGTVTVLTIGFSLVGAIVVMPAVISLMDKLIPHHEPSEYTAKERKKLINPRLLTNITSVISEDDKIRKE